jgi:hypothetical protein
MSYFWHYPTYKSHTFMWFHFPYQLLRSAAAIYLTLVSTLNPEKFTRTWPLVWSVIAQETSPPAVARTFTKPPTADCKSTSSPTADRKSTSPPTADRYSFSPPTAARKYTSLSTSPPVRIRFRIDPPHPPVYRKRLNGRSLGWDRKNQGQVSL